MEHDIKMIADATNSGHLKKLIESHVKELVLDNNHLVIYVDNQHPLQEMEDMGDALNKALEKAYEEDLTWELKLHKGDHPHERENAVPHNVR